MLSKPIYLMKSFLHHSPTFIPDFMKVQRAERRFLDIKFRYS